MSDLQKHNKSKIHKLPLIIKKNSIKACSDYGMFFRRQTNSENVIKEDIIYKATEGDFLHGKYPALCIINRLDVAKNSSRTVATYDSPNGAVIELSSDAVVKLIGQANYDQLFASLCCVINQELKIKGILSLLCPRVPEDTVFSTVESQTIESSFKHLIREKLRRTRQSKRSKLRTYIVEEPVVAKKVVPGKLETELKRVVINPADFTEFRDIKVEVDAHNINDSLHNDKSSIDIKVEPNIQEDGNINSDDNQSISDVKESNAGVTDPFPDLKLIVDEDSNISEVGSIGNLSIGSITSLPNIDVSNAKSILNYIDDHIQFDKQYDNKCKMQTENSTITMIDGSTVTIRGNPDIFHIAEPEILKDLSPTNQKKLMLHQAYLDWKFCLQRDEDDNLPIHLAVLNNDVSLLKRHCLMLKSRHQSTDIVAAGNLTALQMSILRDCPGCTVALLAHGADVMVRDGEARTTLHLAVEIGAEHVKAILDHCMNNAREIVKEHDEFWKPELENEPNDKITKYLLTQINAVCDNQGYTPLMLASKIGNAAAVVLLVAAAPSIVNMPMPTSGNTALYLAVGAACMEAANCGDKTKIPENFKKTVEILVENKADPSIDNHSGNNVNALLAEFHDIALSFVIASKLASINGFGIQKYDDVMLLRDANGVISVADLNKFSINKVKNNPKVYSNSKTIKHSCDADANNSNDNGKNDTIVSGKNCNNDNSITKMAVVEPDKNVKSTAKNYTKSGETVKRPVIIKNLPVVTKIVSLGSNKPVLVKGISPKVAGNGKNLLTKIVAKPNPVKRTITCSMPVTDNISSAPKNILKIFPKPQSETSDTVKKKIPIILKNTAVKRTKCGNGLDHAPSTSKKPRA